MTKTLLKDITQYRKWAFGIFEQNSSPHVHQALGLLPVYDCWDTNEDGEDLDENGNVIVDEAEDNIRIEEWVTELKFPVIAVHCFYKDWDRIGDFEIATVEFVSLSEFTK